jgi:hypothetical protein
MLRRRDRFSSRSSSISDPETYLRTIWAAVLILAGIAPNASCEINLGQDSWEIPHVLRAGIGAEIDQKWLSAIAYPNHTQSSRPFEDELGTGSVDSVYHRGLANEPELIVSVKKYQNHPWASLQVAVRNSTAHEVRVSRIRLLDGSVPELGGPSQQARVRSDSYSEDTPVVRIRDFADAPGGVHLAVGSQLIYNRGSGVSFFAGALTSHRWLTVFWLSSHGLTVDAEGTTALTATKSLDPKRPQDHILLRLTLKPGEELSSGELFVATGRDYLEDLREYGEAVRVANHARIPQEALWGWWSYTAHYFGISEGLASTNADWLAFHLRDAGYDTLHIDEGYAYARGEYTTGDGVRFPHGLEDFARSVTARGLKPGFWTAPFEVSTRSWVYESHKDWLVKNEAGEPIYLGRMKDVDDIYALDPTNPEAQRYLHETYWTMAHVWGARYIKMDFMEASAVEGVHYRPNVSAIEALREGLGIIREAVGDGVILDKDGSPMLAPVGIIDAGRVSNDTEHSFQGTFDAASGIAGRFFMHRNFFLADPDDFCVSNFRSADPAWEELAPVTLKDAKAAIVLSAVAGGLFEIGDDLPGLGSEPDRVALTTNVDLLKMMRLGQAAIPLDLMTYEPGDLQPSIFWNRESRRQGMLAVFNWTESAKVREISLSRLGFDAAHW